MPEGDDQFFGAYDVIEPGDPKASELFSRIHSTKSKLVMPPPKFNVTLSEREKALLGIWIEQGAKYEDHWSFVSVPERFELPAVKDADWVRDDLDRFVLARLEREGVSPSPEASRAVGHGTIRG